MHKVHVENILLYPSFNVLILLNFMEVKFYMSEFP